MTLWYKSGANSWTSVANQTEIDETQWNDGTSLSAVGTPNRYRSLFFVTDDGINWIYPTAEYTTTAAAIEADDPALPAGLTDHPKSTALILAWNASSLPTADGEQWIDVRPIIGGDVSGTVVTHANLAGLSSDDHTIYHLTDGTRDMTGDLTITETTPSITLTDSTGSAKSSSIHQDENKTIWKNSDGDVLLYMDTATGGAAFRSGGLGVNIGLAGVPDSGMRVIGNSTVEGTLTIGGYTLPEEAGLNDQVLKYNGTVIGWEADASGANPEGTDVLSTGEGGGTKFLREDGDGTCSWQTATATTAYDDIGDPDAASSISFDDEEKVVYLTAQDTAGNFFTIANTTDNVANEVYLLSLEYEDDADASCDFIRCIDDRDGSPATLLKVEYDGDTTTAGDVIVNGGNVTAGLTGNLSLDALGTDSDVVLRVDDANTDVTLMTLDGSERQVIIGDNADFDFSIKFDGDNSDGILNYDEDNADFEFDQDVSTTGTMQATDYTASDTTPSLTFTDTTASAKSYAFHIDEDLAIFKQSTDNIDVWRVETNESIAFPNGVSIGAGLGSPPDDGLYVDGNLSVTGSAILPTITGATSIGTITTSNNIKSEPKHLIVNVFDPNGVQTDDGEVCIWPLTPAGLTVTKIEVTLDAITNEVAGDLKYASTFIGLGDATVINDFDTTSGVRSDSSITSGSVPVNSTMYLSFDSAPSADITQMCIDITYDFD